MKTLKLFYIIFSLGISLATIHCGGETEMPQEATTGSSAGTSPDTLTPASPEPSPAPAEPEPSEPTPSVTVERINQDLQNVVVEIGAMLPDFSEYTSCEALFAHNTTGFKETKKCEEAGSLTYEVVSLSCVGQPLEMVGEFKATSNVCVDPEVPAYNGSLIYKIVKDSTAINIRISSEELIIGGAAYELHLNVLVGEPFICTGSIKVNEVIYPVAGENTCKVAT